MLFPNWTLRQKISFSWFLVFSAAGVTIMLAKHGVKNEGLTWFFMGITFGLAWFNSIWGSGKMKYILLILTIIFAAMTPIVLFKYPLHFLI